tara:strand:- start:2527 stop:3213 length:687 start_codon:yes stop_codon:yes gene_type:complete
LNSVIVQKYKPVNHIFIDAFSRDNTNEIIYKYKVKEELINVICFSQKSLGIYQAWNEALIQLLSIIDNDHFIVILNSDDWLFDKYSEKIFENCRSTIIAGACVSHYDDFSIIRPCRSFKLFPLFMPVIDPSLCIKASVYRTIGLYKEKYKVSADYDFAYRAFKSGQSFTILNEPVVNVQMGGFASQNRRIASFENLEIAREWNFNPLPELAFLYRFLKIPRFRFYDWL